MNLPEKVVLPVADVSIGVALLPSAEFREKVAEASLAIAARCENRNIIDEATFPAHVSLCLAGVGRESVSELTGAIGEFATSIKGLELRVQSLRESGRGFLFLALDNTQQLRDVADGVIEICASVHTMNPHYRPHLVRGWGTLSESRRQLLVRYGTYKVQSEWNPHISVASVSADHLADARKVAANLITLPSDVRVESIQLLDIGHDNEKWEVLSSWDV